MLGIPTEKFSSNRLAGFCLQISLVLVQPGPPQGTAASFEAPRSHQAGIGPASAPSSPFGVRNSPGLRRNEPMPPSLVVRATQSFSSWQLDIFEDHFQPTYPYSNLRYTCNFTTLRNLQVRSLLQLVALPPDSKYVKRPGMSRYGVSLVANVLLGKICLGIRSIAGSDQYRFHKHIQSMIID